MAGLALVMQEKGEKKTNKEETPKRKMNKENKEKLILWLNFLKGRGIGDNGNRLTDVFPCAVTDKEREVSQIDNPFFEKPEDWKEFWEIVKKYYPYHSVCGGNAYDTGKKIKEQEISRLKEIINKTLLPKFKLQKQNVLEIGFGYGACGHYLIKEYQSEYYGIDFTYSNKSDSKYRYKNKKRYYTIDKSGIPENLKDKKYSFIFSTNVFQHLTQQQRFDYFKEIYDCLEDRGVFYFDMFAPDHTAYIPENFSTSFFRVYTKVDEIEETRNYLWNNIGFDTVEITHKTKINANTDWIGYKCTKRT